MKRKGTVGAFGKATPAKIAHAKAEGGVQKKRAIFAENMKKIAAKHKREGGNGKRSSGSAHKNRGMQHGPHKAVGSHEGYNL